MYSKFTDKELLAILEMHQSLTYSSKLKLRTELLNRNYEGLIYELEQGIKNENEKITNLEYIEDLGFTVKRSNDSLKLTRSVSAKIMDIFSIFLGIVACYLGFKGLVGLLASLFGQLELGIGGIVFNVLYIIIGSLGIQFLSGIKRLIDYSSFELTVTNGYLKLKKRFDLRLLTIEKVPSDLVLTESLDSLCVKLGENEVLNLDSENYVQKTTLKHLVKEIRSFG